LGSQAAALYLNGKLECCGICVAQAMNLRIYALVALRILQRPKNRFIEMVNDKSSNFSMERISGSLVNTGVCWRKLL